MFCASTRQSKRSATADCVAMIRVQPRGFSREGSAERVQRTPLSNQGNKYVRDVLVGAAKLASKPNHELTLVYEEPKRKAMPIERPSRRIGTGHSCRQSEIAPLRPTPVTEKQRSLGMTKNETRLRC